MSTIPKPSTPPIPIYTIGYGSRTIDALIATLRQYEIAYLVDVRTAPYSRFKPEFSKEQLAAALQAAGIRYLFLGEQLGGRPTDPACYTDGKLDYEKVKAQPFYQAGLNRVQQAFRQQLRVVLMCSEGKPTQCHRSKLIGASLTSLEIPVVHIDEQGAPQSHDDVMLELTNGQLSFFGDPAAMPRNHYAPPPASGQMYDDEDGEDVGVAVGNVEDKAEAMDTSRSIPVRGQSAHVVEASPVRQAVEIDLSALLNRYFGFQEFRPYQRDIIESVLARRDTLAIMSTGAGKSLCYQLPALAFQGLTVVISPLIALMQDQVLRLEQHGIPAATLNSQTDRMTRNQIMRQIHNRELKLLYLSPERLALPDTVELLQAAQVECLVIDEAHCISQWGHDFRPEYREILRVRQQLDDVPILAVTATATPEVRADIVTILQLRDVNEFIAPFNRPNLFLAVQPRRNGKQQTLDFLAEHAGQAGIIYCLTQKGVDALATTLQQAGIPALPYHAGLDGETRTANQRRFILEEGIVMVATIAFGMGIDKPDIRFVLHFNLPRDPESYYQQIGRAGRDGDRAECLLLHAREDFGTHEYFIAQDDPTRAAEAATRLRHMAAWVKEFRCRRKWLLEYFGESDAPEDCGMCDACVAVDNTTPTGSDDLTPYALLFLECAKQVRQKFGTTHLIGILCGSRAEKLTRWKHDQLPIFGQGNGLKRTAWQELTEQFFRLGLVTADDVGAVKLTPRGQAVLDGEKVYGDLKGKRIATSQQTSWDNELFEKLRDLRREVAQARGLPAYTIFHDSSLREMATRLPQTLTEFRTVLGVGEHKATQFGEQFLAVIRAQGKPPTENTAPELRVSPHRATGKGAAEARRALAIAGFQAGRPLQEIAEECGVQPVTVLSYLFRHYKEHQSLPDNITVPRSEVPDDVRQEVFGLFVTRGLDELGPIYWALEQRVGYLDLDLLRLEYLQGEG